MLAKFESFIFLTQGNKVQICEKINYISESDLKEAIDTVFSNHNLTEIEIAMDNITDQLAFLLAQEIKIKITNPKVVIRDGNLSTLTDAISSGISYKILAPKISLSLKNLNYSNTMQRWLSQIVDNYNKLYNYTDSSLLNQFLRKLTSSFPEGNLFNTLPKEIFGLIARFLEINYRDFHSFQITSWSLYYLTRSYINIENFSIIKNFFNPKSHSWFEEFKTSFNLPGVFQFNFDKHHIFTEIINGEPQHFIQYAKKEKALDSFVQAHMALYYQPFKIADKKPYQDFYNDKSTLLSLNLLEDLLTSAEETDDQQVLSALITMAAYNRKNLSAIRQILTVGSYTGSFLLGNQSYPVNINLKNFKFKKRVVIDFSKTSISEEDLSNCYMQRMRIENADLDKINLRGTKLARSSLINSFIDEADLTQADLYKSKLDKAKIRRANLQDANLQSASLFRAKLDFSNLKNANLRNADIRKAKLTGCVLDNADLRNVKGIEQIYKAKSAVKAKMLLTDYYNFFNRNIPTANKLNWFKNNKIEILPDEVTYKYL